MPCLIIVRLVITWSSSFQHIKLWLLLLSSYDNVQFHEFIIIRQYLSVLSNTTLINSKGILFWVHIYVIFKFDPMITEKLPHLSPMIVHRANLVQFSFWQLPPLTSNAFYLWALCNWHGQTWAPPHSLFSLKERAFLKCPFCHLLSAIINYFWSEEPALL